MDRDFERFIHNATYSFVNGEKIYNMLSENRSENMDILICPAHLGDTIWIAIYAETYKKQHNREKLMFAVKDSQREIMEFFGDIDEVACLNFHEMQDLTFYIAFKGLWNANGIRYAHFPIRIGIDSGKLFTSQYNPTAAVHGYMDETRCELLGLSEGSRKKECIEALCPDKELYKKYQNAVMLMPTAISLSLLPKAFWETLALLLKSRGYEVYYNYNDLPEEMVLENAQPLKSSFCEMAGFAKAFRGFIGIRSGICDFLALLDARLTVLYPEDTDYDKMSVDKNAPMSDNIFRLKNSDNIRCFLYRKAWEHELAEKIIDIL